jgi:putative membrane protein
MSSNASFFARWGFALILLPIAACSSTPPPPPPPAAPPAPPPLTEQDSGFINQAALGGLSEVQDGQLAATQGARAAVKAFGQQMVTDHTQANQQLTTLASAKGVTPPTTLSDADKAMLTKLSALHGRAFDMAYLRGQIAGHMQMVKLLEQEIAQGTDPDLKAFAQSTLPEVQAHLAKARALTGVRPVSKKK